MRSTYTQTATANMRSGSTQTPLWRDMTQKNICSNTRMRAGILTLCAEPIMRNIRILSTRKNGRHMRREKNRQTIRVSAKIDIKKDDRNPVNPVTKEQYQSHEIKITDAQFGKKIGKHTSDYGMNPSIAENREKMKTIIIDIVNDAEERFYGEWRGQEYPVLFHVKGDDVVVESSSGEFVTILKGGVTNARVKNARKSKI